MELILRQEDHTYWLDGRLIPGVTRIISPLTDFSRVDPDVLERARQEGVHVHKMVELDCMGDLDVSTLPEWMTGHYQALQKFQADTGFQVVSSEQKLYSQKFDFAGTPDIIGDVPKLPKVKGIALIDVKRSLYAGPAIGIQTAAYLEAWNEQAPKSLRVPKQNRFALQLRPDGQYRLTPFADPGDFAMFLACLTQLRWKEKHYGTSNGNG